MYACSDKLYDTLFAIKCNNQNTDDKVMTMNRECSMLHGLAHNHITQCWGAFIDDYGPNHHRGKIWKMLMECATSEYLFFVNVYCLLFLFLLTHLTLKLGKCFNN